MFNGMDGFCQICTKACLQIRELSPHLCGKHMGKFILQKSNTGEKSATVLAVENLLDDNDRQQQNSFFVLALLHDQGADDEQSEVDQSDTPKQQNRTRNNRFIEDEVGEGEKEGEGEEEFHNDGGHGPDNQAGKGEGEDKEADKEFHNDEDHSMIDLGHFSDPLLVIFCQLAKVTLPVPMQPMQQKQLWPLPLNIRKLMKGTIVPLVLPGGNFAEPQKLLSPKTYFVLGSRGGSTMNV
jgi:hypothetical protein